MITISERVREQEELFRKMLDNWAFKMRNAAPGIVQSFNSAKQTATVQIAIRERINLNGVITWETLPLLVDVPVAMFRAGGYCITFPVNAGDEGLVIFADACIDAWYQSGGVQNQMDKRRHDLSDGFFLPLTWSQPRVISGYSTDSVQVRNENGNAYVEIKGDQINLVSPSKITGQAPEIDFNASTKFQITSPLMSWFIDALASAGSIGSGNVGAVNLNVGTMAVNASTSVDIEAGGNTKIEGREFVSHEHSGVQGGSGNTGGVV